MPITSVNAVIQTLGLQLSSTTADAALVLSADPAIVLDGEITYAVSGNVLSLSYTATVAHGSGAEATTFDLTAAAYDTFTELAAAITAWDPVAAGVANITATVAAGADTSAASSLLSSVLSTTATGGVVLNYSDPYAATDYALITTLVTDVTSIIERLTGRTIDEAALDERYDGSGTPYLQLNSWPVDSITAVSTIASDGTATTLAATEYRLDSLLGCLYRLTSTDYGWVPEPKVCWPKGFQNVRVQYTAGYSSVPDDLERIGIEMIVYRYLNRKRNMGASSRSLGDDSRAYRSETEQAMYERRLLAPYAVMRV